VRNAWVGVLAGACWWLRADMPVSTAGEACPAYCVDSATVWAPGMNPAGEPDEREATQGR